MDPLINLRTPDSLRPAGQVGVAPPQGDPGAQGVPSFRDLLQRAIDEVNTDEEVASQEARNLMTGQGTDMHTAILAVQKADVSFYTMMAVRSKLIDAYREVMRMQM
ncbi:MAG: flagellar hook-basal body complex protein FliE [Holophagales bacterium]|nr:flagellar hook-basal body complex protein FliE [Holophagales bacterium]